MLRDISQLNYYRLRELIQVHPGGAKPIEFLLSELADFTGDDWEHEDDVTFMPLERKDPSKSHPVSKSDISDAKANGQSEILAEFELPSEAGMERQAMDMVAEALNELNISEAQLEKLKTAVAEATMNGIEHGNHFNPELPVKIKVLKQDRSLAVHITDQGGDRIIADKGVPNLEAKLAGLQSPRGWGLFLIKNMVDNMQIIADSTHHTVVLTLLLKGVEDANETT